MKLNDKQKKIIDIVQWLCIIFLVMYCIFGSFLSKKNLDKNNIEYQKEQTYVKIYESQNIEKLKKENKILYDSIKHLTDVESALEVKYRYKYITDTIKVTEFVYLEKDSIYHYVENTDTISLEIDVKATNLQWITNRFTINDKFMIINREKNNINQTLIHHSPNAEIDNLNIWHRPLKNKWYHNFHVGIQAGVGYGLIYKQPDVYVGVGVSYTFK